jgi:hypothetical protein
MNTTPVDLRAATPASSGPSASSIPQHARGTLIATTYAAARTLLARDAPSLGAAWPNPEHQLLLIAVCGERDRAIAAWEKWAASPFAADLDALGAGMSRLLGHTARRLRGFGVRDPLLERALPVYRHTWCTNQLRVHAAIAAIGTLDKAKITALPLKGLALLTGYYPDLGLRPMLDIDLLVAPEHLGRALKALMAEGWRPLHQPVHPTMLQGTIPNGGYSCDLHRANTKLDLHWYALAQDPSVEGARPFFTHARPRALGNTRVLCPNVTELLFHVCAHGVGWNALASTLWAADAHCLITSDEPIDWRRLVTTAAARRLTVPIYDALCFLSDKLGTPVPQYALDALGATVVCELEPMEHAADALRPGESSVPERWAKSHLTRRRRNGTLGPGAILDEATLRALDAKAPNAVAPPAIVPNVARASEPLISCLCVTENRAAFIPWMLWNYDRQTWARRELVIVDSSEPPLALPARPDVRIVRAPPKTPLGQKRNMALDAAQGEAFAWFDDDDWQHPLRLAWLVRLLTGSSGGANPTHAGPRRAWFVDLFGDGCMEHVATGAPLFNGSLFNMSLVKRYRFRDDLRQLESTMWLDTFQHVSPSVSMQPHMPPVFFWLSHDANAVNVRRTRRFNRPLGHLRTVIGDDWGDTDAQLAALRGRLGTLATASTPSARANAQPATPRLWVITPCMNRLSFLKQTAPRLLAQRDIGFCLVDYSCPESSGDWLEAEFASAVRAGRCIVERVRGKTLFNKSAAHNAGARRAIAAGAEHLCFLDVDTVVEPRFFEWLAPRLDTKRFLIAGRDDAGFDVPSLTGLLVVGAGAFAGTDGFDEGFRGWGSEDVEMRLRLHVLHGLPYEDVPASLTRALPHDDELRASHYDERNIGQSDRRNFSRAVAKLHTWRKIRPFDPGTTSRLFYKPPIGSSIGGPPATR